MKVKVAQLCLTLCDPMDYTVHGILQARILEWVAFPFSRGSSQPRDWTEVSHIAGEFFINWGMRKNDPHQKTKNSQRRRRKKPQHIGTKKLRKVEKNLIGQTVKAIETEGYAIAYSTQKYVRH